VVPVILVVYLLEGVNPAQSQSTLFAPELIDGMREKLINLAPLLNRLLLSGYRGAFVLHIDSGKKSDYATYEYATK